MNTTVQLSIPLTTDQLADLIRQQLPKQEQLRLVSLLQTEEESEPTNEEVLEDFRKAYRELKQGTLKTRPAKEFLNEL